MPWIFCFFLFVSASYAQAPETAGDAESGAAQEKLFNAESFTLDNGMDVVVIPNHRVPVVTHMVWYGVGAADEKRGHSGLAHFLEHLMFKGTENIPPGEFSKRVRALGGNDNAFTAQDVLAYHQSIAREHLETVMQMEAERMNGLLLPPEEVESELLVVLEERRQRTDNTPTGYFFEQMNTALFPNHPYGTPVIGWMQEMEKMDRAAAKEFYDKWYAPNNALLVVSGDVTAAELKPLAEKIYGELPREDVPEREWTEVPKQLANTLITMHHPLIRQPKYYRMYRAPSSNMDKDAALALDILASILGDGAASRFYKSLVVEQKLASWANFRYNGGARSHGTMQISANLTEGVDMETLDQAINEELRKLVADGVTAAEIAEAKTRLIDSAIFARDSVSGPAMIFGYSLMTGSTMDDIEYWPHDIKAVTADQINAAARKYLDPDKSGDNPYVTGYLLPQSSAKSDSAEGTANDTAAGGEGAE